MLTDLPLAAVRYAALVNTALRRSSPDAGRFIDWNRHAAGVYEEVGFYNLPWLVQHPHDTALWAIKDVDARLAELVRQGYRSDYGSADTTEQVLERYPDLVTSDEQYLITFHTLTRTNSPDWRWHKNGEYIGTRSPQCEHLGDEPDIDQVISWSIWQVLPDAPGLEGHWRPELSQWLVARMSGQRIPPLVLDHN